MHTALKIKNEGKEIFNSNWSFVTFQFNVVSKNELTKTHTYQRFIPTREDLAMLEMPNHAHS